VKPVAYEVIVTREDGSRVWLFIRESNRFRALGRAVDYGGPGSSTRFGVDFHTCPESAAVVVLAYGPIAIAAESEQDRDRDQRH
jgi:hypothetical protein